MQKKQNYIGEKKIDQIKFRIFPSSNSAYSLYEDDGKSLNYTDGQYLLTRIMVNKNPDLDIKIDAERGKFNPENHSYLLNIYRDLPVTNISFNGTSVKKFNSPVELAKNENGYYFDPENKMLSVKVQKSLPAEIKVE